MQMYFSEKDCDSRGRPCGSRRNNAVLGVGAVCGSKRENGISDVRGRSRRLRYKEEECCVRGTWSLQVREECCFRCTRLLGSSRKISVTEAGGVWGFMCRRRMQLKV